MKKLLLALLLPCVAQAQQSTERIGKFVTLGDPPATATGKRAECPPEMALIDGKFCIDRYEASLVEIGAQGETPWAPNREPKGVKVRAISAAGYLPQGYISGIQSKAACEASGKRLCAPAEWMRACEGAAKTLYPHGNSYAEGDCNDARVKGPGVVAEACKCKPKYDDKDLMNPAINLLPNTLRPNGDAKYSKCVSAEGVFNLVGSLHEWLDDPKGTFAGGYYQDIKLNGLGCRYRTTAHDVGHRDYSTGFRCCKPL